jgi:hypothetical protein
MRKQTVLAFISIALKMFLDLLIMLASSTSEFDHSSAPAAASAWLPEIRLQLRDQRPQEQQAATAPKFETFLFPAASWLLSSTSYSCDP